jgi:hypothetical protein
MDPLSKGQAVQDKLPSRTAFPLDLGPMTCTETSVTTNLLCATSQKSKDIVDTRAEASNYADHLAAST